MLISLGGGGEFFTISQSVISRGGMVAWWLVCKVLASHQCDPGLIPAKAILSGVVHWFTSMPQGFFTRPSGFPPSENSNTFNLWLCSVVMYW